MFYDSSPTKYTYTNKASSSTMHPQDLSEYTVNANPLPLTLCLANKPADTRLHTAISVVLTSCKAPADHRRLTLVPGEPITIGRASRSKESLEASSTNALFDCPVVSREHAQLRAHPWAATGDQVSIVDLGSMHGTRVNGTKLQRGQRMSLRHGNVLQFGEKVTRGEGTAKTPYEILLSDFETDYENDTDMHEGIKVVFDRIPADSTQNSHTFAGSQPNSFYVPEVSDEEDSDSPREEQMYDDISDQDADGYKSSSAHTTPEQAKPTPGSAEQPIDIDSIPVPRRAPQAIYVSDEDADMMPPPPPKRIESFNDGAKPMNIYNSLKVVQDSIDKDNSIYEPGNLQNIKYHSTPYEEAYASYPKYDPYGSVYCDDGAHSQSEDESSEQDDEMEYDDGDDAEDDDNAAEDEYLGERYCQTDPESPYDVDEEAEHAHHEAELSSSKKQPSPELGSTTGYEALSASAMPRIAGCGGPVFSGFLQSSQASRYSNARYDPVRSSQGSLEQPIAPNYVCGPLGRDWAIRGPSTYTYDAPPSLNWNTCGEEPGTNSFRSSRWDIGPSPPAPPPLAPIQASSFDPLSLRSAPLAPQPSPHSYAEPLPWFSNQHSPQSDDVSFAMPAARKLDGNQPKYQYDWGFKSPSPKKSTATAPSQGQLFAATSSHANEQGKNKNKISIDELVEYEAKGVDEGQEGLQKKSLPTGTKRKAVEISNYEPKEAVPTTAASEESMLTALENALALPPEHMKEQLESIVEEQEAEEPAAKKLRADPETFAAEPQAIVAVPVPAPAQRGSSVAQVAKYAGSAMLGGVATMAFLCSPLAEKALEYLA